MSSVLFVVTAARRWTLSDGSPHPTGYWAEELLTPYRLLTEAGHTVAFATPGGVAPVVDEGSLGGDDADEIRAALAEIPGLDAPRPLDQVDVSTYDAVFYPGGHGPMQDLSSDKASGALITAAIDNDITLAMVCHGLAALIAATRPDGSAAAAGRTVAAFTDAEEVQGGLADRAPWLLETTLRQHAIEVDAAEPWADHVVVDGNLVTGQNPQSSASVAHALLEKLA